MSDMHGYFIGAAYFLGLSCVLGPLVWMILQRRKWRQILSALGSAGEGEA